MKLRAAVIVFVLTFCVVAIYNVCYDTGGAVDTLVGVARRITYGALFAVGFCAASLVLRKWMSIPPRPASASGMMTSPAMPANVSNGPGQYRVRGIDRDTKFETSEIVIADSPENAKFKVELKGVDVKLVEAV